MARTIENFRAVALSGAPTKIHIDDDGMVVPKAAAGAKTHDAKGAMLSPGWCDLHVHVWHGGTDFSVRAERAGRRCGVTAMADAGSAGEASFHGLREYVIEPAAETIRAFINIGSIGLVACNRVSELIDMRSIDIDRTLGVIEANRDVICGVKIRASGVILGSWGMTPVRIAKRVAEIAQLPLMVHVGEPPPLIDEVFQILRPGDIVTHCFNGKAAGSIFDTKSVWEMARTLQREGIRMDVGHGAASLDFDVARRAIGEGFLPFSISTDLHGWNVDGPVHDLALTASKMLELGMDLEECVAAITHRPRSVMGLGPLPKGKPHSWSSWLKASGGRADFTLFNLCDGKVAVRDSADKPLVLKRTLRPQSTIIGESLVTAHTPAWLDGDPAGGGPAGGPASVDADSR